MAASADRNAYQKCQMILQDGIEESGYGLRVGVLIYTCKSVLVGVCVCVGACVRVCVLISHIK